MEIIKNASRWGNSAGVILPKKWIGKQVKIILIDRTENIEKEVMEIIKKYLEDIIGIYIVGSYSRNDYTDNSDIDIIAISNETKKELSSGKYNISIYPLESVKKTLNANPVLIYPRILESKTIINKKLLEELKKEKIGGSEKYIDETRRIIKINEGIIKIKPGKIPDSVIYSLVLRIKGLLLIKNMKDKKILMKKEFLNYLKKVLGEKSDEIIMSYERIKNNLPEMEIIDYEIAERLLDSLKNEIKWQTKKE
ncbi:hypothetical protein COU59_00845 [Candidatus Pacearchaeota archaeon CG10_big_fil_rev_8_21_14_0_10_34_12]|nr:MAG: hypothetical protein COU59_00845 [Candidatus Pacearchaeota archaeon CG10_big_fil_rev_8_21_14_0_10_34_12]